MQRGCGSGSGAAVVPELRQERRRCPRQPRLLDAVRRARGAWGLGSAVPVNERSRRDHTRARAPRSSEHDDPNRAELALSPLQATHAHATRTATSHRPGWCQRRHPCSTFSGSRAGSTKAEAWLHTPMYSSASEDGIIDQLESASPWGARNRCGREVRTVHFDVLVSAENRGRMCVAVP